ncbi:hypothetical protein [Xylanimonas ulmi]|uniref:DUF5134 domain-containing protein n=1 Tax=Xylanimonas ulmi TaxID=228973 RepID=A0A4Q7M6N7_9MICO|nr:hypothetical protein [Xylanibacterium ulmi]RZS62302.1 hypothetical protein EV386_2631 [Xylanibacterium ulmi]
MHGLHVVALVPAAVTVACAARRPAGTGRVIAVATGALMTLAMADLAVLPGGLPAPFWAAAMLGAGVVAAAVGRDLDSACRPLHLLHVSCLLVMAALTLAGAGGLGGVAPGAGAGGRASGLAGHAGHAGHSGSLGSLGDLAADPLTTVALAGATAVVVAGVALTLRRVPEPPRASDHAPGRIPQPYRALDHTPGAVRRATGLGPGALARAEALAGAGAVALMALAH